MQAWWQTLTVRARVVFAGAVLAILMLTGGLGWWLLHPDRAVLFADLRPQDAATMATELDKLKIDYAVADNGATLLVDRAQVHATRMKLMGRDLPLHGAVGFELFNNADFGMTEFAQKINYQRALQGELTRTILSFPEVRDARVHLALPEQGLFRQPSSRPKAAVTLSMRSGLSLRPEQVSGIQRLVAAAVPGMAAAEVTLLDEQGVALSRAAAESEADAGSARLDLKRETENYLSRKAGAVLERAFGPGQALATVDATLNMEQVRVTTEDVIPAVDARAGAATGVLVRERESARDSAGAEGRVADVRPTRGSSMQREVEYQAGRRVEQVVSQPGSIRRLQVVAVLRPVLDGQQQEEVRRMLAAAVGASFERGDTVVVQSFQAAGRAALPAPLATGNAEAAPSAAAPEDYRVALAALAALVLLGLAGWTLQRRRRASFAPALLTDGERRAALRRVEAWLEEGSAAKPLADRRGVA